MQDITAAPTQDRYFEDYPQGATFDLGSIAVTAEEVESFARRYDPQSFHVDPQAAADSMFGGIIASGWHTGSLIMRLLVQGYLSQASSLGSPGIDELRWLRPVRPGDVLSVRVTVAEANRSRSKPDRGVVRSLIEARNQDGEPVMSMRALNLVRCRNPA